jgi:O-antigen/teichoic acid export membrane protein
MSPMAMTDAKDLPAQRSFQALSARLRAWLAGDHGVARRMAGTAFIIRVVSSAVVFLSHILLARWMGSFEFGIYVYVWTWLLLLGDLVHMGLPLAAQRHIPEYIHRNQLDLLRGYLIGSRWLTFGLGTAAAILGAAIVHAAAGSLDRNMIVPFYLACVALPFYALSLMLDGVARAYNWIAVGLMPHSLLRPLLILGLIIGFSVFGLPINATTTMLVTAIAVWITTLGQLLVLDRRLARLVATGERAIDVKHWFAISLPLMAVWGVYTLLTTTDVIVLQLFRPSDEVAHYFAVSKTLTGGSMVYFAVMAAAAHRFAAYHAAGDREGLANFAAMTIRWTFWPSLAVVIALLILGKPILWLFGPGFDAAYPIMFVLAIGLMARAAVGPAERLLMMVGQQYLCALAYVVAFAVNLIGCFVLAKPYGGMGVAIATTAAFVCESALLYLIARLRLGLHLFVWR